MKLGVYTAALHEKPLPEALDDIKKLGLEGAEINSGGFLRTPHLPVRELLASADARSEYLGLFKDKGIELTALNCNGNPLDPTEVGESQAEDIFTSIEIAAHLGLKRVITMSGAPGSEPGSTLPVWNVVPWHSAFLEVQEYQWNEVGIPFWKKIQAFAADHDVRVCIEMHPGNIVFNPRSLERLVTEISATHVGAELDPSHLFWQGIDPTEAVKSLGELVYNAAAKDTRINPISRVNGNIDDSFRFVEKGDPHWLDMGGDYWLSGWPLNPSWDFVAVGKGHDVKWWRGFLNALRDIDPNMAVNIEHEDREMGQWEGLELAAETLKRAAGRPVEQNGS